MMTTTERPNAWQLANLADVSAPDSLESPGARWLELVHDVAGEIVLEYTRDDRRDAIHERADSLVPVYTHDRWQVFVDLGAYGEDTTELGDDGGDLTRSAGIALYMIAERLLYTLLEDYLDV